MGLRLVAALAAILLSSSAHAGVAEELTAAINKCAAITDDGTRHACYDQLPALLKTFAAGAAAEAPASVAAQPKASPPADEKGFLAGLFDRSGNEPKPADIITATIESFTSDYGLFVVTLDNGQVWRQVAAIGDLLHFSKEKKDRVAIWRNSFGEYVLRMEGYHTTYHVRRIR